MSKIAFTSIIIALTTAIILSSSVVADTFAKSSSGDSNSGSDGGDKPKTSENKKQVSQIQRAVSIGKKKKR